MAQSWSLLLTVPNFRYLFLSNISIGLGQWFQSVGLAWLVTVLTGDPRQLGGVVGTQGVSAFLTSPFAGVLADRFHRRTLLMTTTSINAIQAITLAVVVGTGHGQIWMLYLFAAIGGAANSVTQPVRQAFVYDAVGREQVARAVPINNIAQSSTRVIGPALAGFIIGQLGNSSAFYFQGALAALAMLLTSRIGATLQVRSVATRESPIKTLTQGIRYVAADPCLRGQVFIQIIPVLLVYPYVQFLVFFARELGGGVETYGFLATGAGYGGVVALILLTMIGEPKHKGWFLLVAVIGYPVSVAFFSQAPSVPIAMAFLILNGFWNQTYTAMQNMLFLLSAREDMRGRVMGLYYMIQQGLAPVGQIALGFAISAWGPPDAVFRFELIAIALLVTAAIVLKPVRDA